MISPRPAAKALLIISIALLSACSSTTNRVNSFGNRVLRIVGYSSPKTETNAISGLAGNNNISREEEYYLGRGVAASILTSYKLIQDQKLISYVNRIGHTVAAFSDLPETFGGYHFAIIDSNEFNAISAPGGIIFVTKGLVDKMPDEDSLAAVLAHEIGHVQKQHGINAISKEHATSALQKIGKAAAVLSCNEVLAGGVVVFSSAVGDIVDKLLVSGYSKDQEFEADRIALNILQRSGYNPLALLKMLEALHALEGNKHSGWFATHPKPSDRIAVATTVIAENNITENTTGKLERTKRFSSIR